MTKDKRHVDYLINKYRRDLSRLTTNLPATLYTLTELLAMDEPVEIPLKDGGNHSIDPGDLQRLADDLPWYMHKLVRLPFILVYTSVGDGRVYKVQGGAWEKRAIEQLLHGTFTVEGVSEVEPADVRRLLRRYKTLVFVSLSI